VLHVVFPSTYAKQAEECHNEAKHERNTHYYHDHSKDDTHQLTKELQYRAQYPSHPIDPHGDQTERKKQDFHNGAFFTFLHIESFFYILFNIGEGDGLSLHLHFFGDRLGLWCDDPENDVGHQTCPAKENR